jgi:hypothetical protein
LSSKGLEDRGVEIRDSVPRNNAGCFKLCEGRGKIANFVLEAPANGEKRIGQFQMVVV